MLVYGQQNAFTIIWKGLYSINLNVLNLIFDPKVSYINRIRHRLTIDATLFHVPCCKLVRWTLLTRYTLAV